MDGRPRIPLMYMPLCIPAGYLSSTVSFSFLFVYGALYYCSTNDVPYVCTYEAVHIKPYIHQINQILLQMTICHHYLNMIQTVNNERSFLNERNTIFKPQKFLFLWQAPDSYICWHFTSFEFIFFFHYLEKGNLSPVLLLPVSHNRAREAW